MFFYKTSDYKPDDRSRKNEKTARFKKIILILNKNNKIDSRKLLGIYKGKILILLKIKQCSILLIEKSFGRGILDTTFYEIPIILKVFSCGKIFLGLIRKN